MKINELKSPYRELAEMRESKQPSNTCDETFGFAWGNSKEGHDWWWLVWCGEYPEIPQSSLDELKEYQNPAEDEHTKDDKLFTAAVAAMQGCLANHTMIDTFSQSATESVAKFSWSLAEALIAEGKERKYL